MEGELCFNPRPVYKPGDTYFMSTYESALLVSIHARFISRAIHSVKNEATQLFLFQSTPGL